MFYLCFPLFVAGCRVTNLWCERVELAWELFRDRYAADMPNDAANGLEFFSFKFVHQILQEKSCVWGTGFIPPYNLMGI